jgi:hypothetical protein
MSAWWVEASRENFELVRRLVEHEDGLINVRTNWALAFHALLFNAFVGGVALYEKVRFGQSCFDPIACGLILACLLGVGSAVAAFAGVWFIMLVLVIRAPAMSPLSPSGQ